MLGSSPGRPYLLYYLSHQYIRVLFSGIAQSEQRGRLRGLSPLRVSHLPEKAMDFSLVFDFSDTHNDAQGLLPTLHSGITLGRL